jgi:uncharacterized protein YggT (Ycf19 family)
MQKTYFVKNQLRELYSFVLSYDSYLPYKYIIIKAFSSGRKRFLYILRFLLRFKQLMPKLFLIFASSSNILTFILRGSTFFIPIRFWILILHHFRFFYEALLTIRLVAEWYPSINLHQGGTFEQIIFSLSEPYFKIFEEILPKGLSALFSFYLIDHLGSIIELFYRALVIYGGGSRKKSWIESVDLINLAMSSEKLIHY